MIIYGEKPWKTSLTPVTRLLIIYGAEHQPRETFGPSPAHASSTPGLVPV